MSKRSRLLKFFLIMICIAVPLASCSKEPEEGTISDVEIADSNDDSTYVENGFVKADSPYDYEYKTFELKKAKMAFDVPASWSVNFRNARCIEIKTPDEDPFLPAATINLLVNYGYNTETNEFSEYTLNDKAYNFSQLFKDELAGLTFYVHGRPCHLRQYYTEDAIYNGLDIVNEEHKSDAATLVVNSVVMVDHANNYYPKEYGQVETYFKWGSDPCLLTTVARTEVLDSARKMLEYMVSTMKSIPYENESYKNVSYEDFSLQVPVSFAQVGDGNIFLSSLTENNATSGMSVDVYKIQGSKASDITEDVLNENVGFKMVDGAFNSYGQDLVCSPSFYKNEEEDGSDYTGMISVTPSAKASPVDYAGKEIGTASYYQADFYVTEKNDDVFIIMVAYQSCQEELAKEAGRTAVSSFVVKK